MFSRRRLLVSVAAAVLVALGAALAGPGRAEAAPARGPAAAWPVPVPRWFWPWARWYLGRAEFAQGPLRSPATRPPAAPERIPAWAWRRLAVLTGAEPPPAPPPERPVVRTWPLPIPGWFWTWARWYLHRGEFAAAEPRSAATRPASAPSPVPPWAWHRLAVIAGGAPPRLPAGPLRPGAKGEQVATLQRALKAAGYAVGPVDGEYGAKTSAAVVAWEKLHRRDRDGVVQPEEVVDILRTRRPSPPLARSGAYVHVDLARQVLFEVRGGRVLSVVPVSTGGGYTYVSSNGRATVARTPRGSFRVYRKATGWRESYLGRLFYPSFFTGGYAIHGSTSVPPTPVSHGCVRIPMWLSVAFYERNPVGTPVIVR